MRGRAKTCERGFCAATPAVQTRCGSVGSVWHRSGTCPHLLRQVWAKRSRNPPSLNPAYMFRHQEKTGGTSLTTVSEPLAVGCFVFLTSCLRLLFKLSSARPQAASGRRHNLGELGATGQPVGPVHTLVVWAAGCARRAGSRTAFEPGKTSIGTRGNKIQDLTK